MGLMDKVEIYMKEALLFLLVEHSGKLSIPEMDMVNTGMKELMAHFKSIMEHWNVSVKIAALAFSQEARWITEKGPVEAGELIWENLTAKEISNFGIACSALKEKLSKKMLMQKLCGNSTPNIVLLSTGNHNDIWEKPLSLLWENDYFKNAWKLCLAVGENANLNPLIRFTGTDESVIKVTVTDMAVKKNIESSDICEVITIPITRLFKQRYFIDDWSPDQIEELEKGYGVADWSWEVKRSKSEK